MVVAVYGMVNMIVTISYFKLFLSINISNTYKSNKIPIDVQYDRTGSPNCPLLKDKIDNVYTANIWTRGKIRKSKKSLKS